jgi:thiamine kinase-like enzyme
MIDILKEVLAEQFGVTMSEVKFISSEIHTDGEIHGFEILNQHEPTFIYAQVGSSEWSGDGYQIHLPEIDAWVRLWRFPNDPYLHGLVMVGVKEALSELLKKLDSSATLQAVTNVAYRPGKRAVFQVRTNREVLYAKVTSVTNAKRIIQLQESLPKTLLKPELRGMAEGGILFFTELEGSGFLDLEKIDMANFLVQLNAVHRELAKIQVDTDVKRKVVTNLEWYVSIIQRQINEPIAKQVSALAARLTPLDLSGQREFIHGDLHLGQFKIQKKGGLGVLDFDNAGMGYRVEDQASLLASALFGYVANLESPHRTRYAGFLRFYCDELQRDVEPEPLQNLTIRHLVAYLASFPALVMKNQGEFARILAGIENDENPLMLISSFAHEPM